MSKHLQTLQIIILVCALALLSVSKKTPDTDTKSIFPAELESVYIHRSGFPEFTTQQLLFAIKSQLFVELGPSTNYTYDLVRIDEIGNCSTKDYTRKLGKSYKVGVEVGPAFNFTFSLCLHANGEVWSRIDQVQDALAMTGYLLFTDGETTYIQNKNAYALICQQYPKVSGSVINDEWEWTNKNSHCLQADELLQTRKYSVA